jgi:hypothetical protein
MRVITVYLKSRGWLVIALRLDQRAVKSQQAVVVSDDCRDDYISFTSGTGGRCCCAYMPEPSCPRFCGETQESTFLLLGLA